MKSKIISINGYKCKLTLVEAIIKENDFVISKHRFIDMDENGIYHCTTLDPFDVEIEKVILINIGTDNNPEMVLGFHNGGTCGKALQENYSIVEVELV